MRRARQYRQSPDGGRKTAHFPGQKLPEGWTLHDGPIPGPDLLAEAIREAIREAAIGMMVATISPERVAEIEQEVRSVNRL